MCKQRVPARNNICKLICPVFVSLSRLFCLDDLNSHVVKRDSIAVCDLPPYRPAVLRGGPDDTQQYRQYCDYSYFHCYVSDLPNPIADSKKLSSSGRGGAHEVRSGHRASMNKGSGEFGR